jgi:TonB-linked SusC/RagA family outer membrane protein
MNQTFTQHDVVPRHALRSKSKDVSQPQYKHQFLKLITAAIFYGQVVVFGLFIQFVTSKDAIAQTTAQNIPAKGRVVDDKDGSGIPGITISDQTRKVYGTTNEKGEFSISVPRGTTLNFSMIGFTTISRTINEVQNSLAIRIKESTNELNEVVVTTALGIKRAEKSLGYSVTTVDSTQLTNAVSSNWTDALSGKVAGLNLVRNGGPAGSNKIILRGENNLTGDNEALIVIDGVVASSSSRRTAATGGGVYGTSGDIMPADFGSGLNDLNPDDIESVQVLKGPGAAALYGQRGANGAILITTKSGNANRKKVGISFSSNTSIETINKSPDIQNEFGQGRFGVPYFSYGATEDGPSTNGTSATWGAPFAAGGMYYQYDPLTKRAATFRTPWVAYENPIQSFFKTGYESLNSVSIDGTVKKVSLRFSASHGQLDWIAPNTGMERTSASLTANTNLTSKWSLTVKAAYNNRNSDNLPATGYGNQSLMYWFMFAQPNVNTDWYRDYWAPGLQYRQFANITTTNPESPYAISYEYINGQKRNGLTGNVQSTYKFTKELSLMVRTTIDMIDEFRDTRRPWDAAGNKFAHGSYRETNVNSYEWSSDFLLRYDKKISNDFNISATAGGSQLRNEYKKSELRADGLVIPNIYRLENNENPLIYVPDTSRYRINSFYGLMSFAFRNYLFLDVTGRQDWSSTLAVPINDNPVGVFYPSANLAFAVSDLWKMPKAISFLKLRASYSEVGSGGKSPYQTAYNYTQASNGIYPENATANPSILPNLNLKPLRTTTIELGLDLRMFKNRLNLDFAIYSGNTKNQILSREVDRSTGYTRAIFNAGRVDNKGLEVALNGTVLQNKNFKWTLNGTFSANRNEIKELADSSVILRAGALGGGQVIASVGGSMGDLYGRGLVRSPDGQIVYDANGNARFDNLNLIYLGNTIPKFRFSFGTGITYKEFTVNALFDAQLGAVGHSLTFSRMAALGKLKVTLPGRYNGIIGPGVTQNADGSYRPNDITATDFETYYSSIYGSDHAEGSIFRTDYLKFREANITYAFKKSFVNKLGLSKLTVGAYGRNLFIWSPWPAFDPEFGTLAGSDIQQGFETGQLPSTRTFGARLTFGL